MADTLNILNYCSIICFIILIIVLSVYFCGLNDQSNFILEFFKSKTKKNNSPLLSNNDKLNIIKHKMNNTKSKNCNQFEQINSYIPKKKTYKDDKSIFKNIDTIDWNEVTDKQIYAHYSKKNNNSSVSGKTLNNCDLNL